MTELKEKFLRSARLARGFQVIHQGVGAHSLWTAPYTGGVALVPGAQQAPVEVPETASEETVTSVSGAFTIWTAHFLPESHSAQEAATSESDEAEAVVVTLPTVDADGNTEPMSATSETSDGDDGEGSADAEAGEPTAAVDSTEDADGSANDSPTEPLRILPKSPDSGE